MLFRTLQSRFPPARPSVTPSCHQIHFANVGQFQFVLPENKSLFQSFSSFPCYSKHMFIGFPWAHHIISYRLLSLCENAPSCLPWHLFHKLFSDLSKSSLPGRQACAAKRARALEFLELAWPTARTRGANVSRLSAPVCITASAHIRALSPQRHGEG